MVLLGIGALAGRAWKSEPDLQRSRASLNPPPAPPTVAPPPPPTLPPTRSTLGVRSVSVAEDGKGVRCLAGGFIGVLDLGDQLLESEDEGEDVFVARIERGKTVWSQRFGGKGQQSATDVAIEKDGSCVIAGTFEGELKLGSKSLQAAPGQHAVFLATVAGPTTIRDAEILARDVPAGATVGVTLNGSGEPLVAVGTQVGTSVGRSELREGAALIRRGGVVESSSTGCFDLCTAHSGAAIPTGYTGLCGGDNQPSTCAQTKICNRKPNGTFYNPTCCRAAGGEPSTWNYTSTCASIARNQCPSSVCSSSAYAPVQPTLE
jgi:hypothetical protein